MDLNEICMNLVPFPRLHYLIPAMTPLYSLLDVALPPRRCGLGYDGSVLLVYMAGLTKLSRMPSQEIVSSSRLILSMACTYIDYITYCYA